MLLQTTIQIDLSSGTRRVPRLICLTKKMCVLQFVWYTAYYIVYSIDWVQSTEFDPRWTILIRSDWHTAQTRPANRSLTADIDEIQDKLARHLRRSCHSASDRFSGRALPTRFPERAFISAMFRNVNFLEFVSYKLCSFLKFLQVHSLWSEQFGAEKPELFEPLIWGYRIIGR